MDYSDKYLQHFSDPQNIGEIPETDNIAEVEHQGGGCFDRIRLTLNIEEGIVIDARFKARACSGTIAACSAVTEWIKGKKVEQAKQLTDRILTEELGGVPPQKQHSVELAVKAVITALKR